MAKQASNGSMPSAGRQAGRPTSIAHCAAYMHYSNMAADFILAAQQVEDRASYDCPRCSHHKGMLCPEQPGMLNNFEQTGRQHGA